MLPLSSHLVSLLVLLSCVWNLFSCDLNRLMQHYTVDSARERGEPAERAEALASGQDLKVKPLCRAPARCARAPSASPAGGGVAAEKPMWTNFPVPARATRDRCAPMV